MRGGDIHSHFYLLINDTWTPYFALNSTNNCDGVISSNLHMSTSHSNPQLSKDCPKDQDCLASDMCPTSRSVSVYNSISYKILHGTFEKNLDTNRIENKIFLTFILFRFFLDFLENSIKYFNGNLLILMQNFLA